jgi:hypothetical protein
MCNFKILMALGKVSNHFMEHISLPNLLNIKMKDQGSNAHGTLHVIISNSKCNWQIYCKSSELYKYCNFSSKNTLSQLCMPENKLIKKII